MNQQVKAGLSAIRDFLAGRSNEAEAAASEDKETREVVAAELVAAMSGPNASGEMLPKPAETAVGSSGVTAAETDAASSEEATPSPRPTNSGAAETPSEQEQERARQLFLEHGYFDEAVDNLRAANSPADRAAAARSLGLVGSRRATAHLIAAMFDEDAEVRRAAEDAIRQIDDPTVADLTGQAETKPVIAQMDMAAATEPSLKIEESKAEQSTPAAETVSQQVAVEPPAVPADSLAGSSVAKFPEVPSAPLANADDLNEAATATTSDEENLLAQERSINETVAEIGRQVLEATNAFKKSEEAARTRLEREAKVRAEAAESRREEEKQRKRAEEAAAAQGTEERKAIKLEQAARAKAEAEAQRLADEETKLRLKAATLRLDAAELARRRADMETARREAAEAAREAEVRRERDEARASHEAVLQRLHHEEQALQQATEETRQQQTNLRVARERLADDIERLKEELAAAEAAQREEADRLRAEAERLNNEAQDQLRAQMEDLRGAEVEVAKRRAEVEVAREKAAAEAQRLVEAQARMRAGEEARAEAERERARLEAEINQQVESHVQLLEETRRRGQEEVQRIQEEIRQNTEREQQRLSELELQKTRAEVESAQRAEKERQILAQIDSVRIADAETRRRIEDAEVRRRATEDAYRLVAEKVQRVEAEAHAREKEEERMLTKLEAERRTVAIEAQSRAEQEKRIREEIAMFRRLEEEQRPLIEKATLELADIERRVQEGKDRLREQEKARESAKAELFAAGERQAALVEPLTSHAALESTPESSGTQASALVSESTAELSDLALDEHAPAVVAPAIATYLKSVDPYKRAAAVAELARAGSPDAFTQITDCFDDPSPHVRNAAARALRKLEPERTVDMFNRALETGSAERRRNIGAAIAASGLAQEAINNLASSSREESYNALSILFVMAKTGEIEPLVQALEEHKSDDIGKAVSKLLSLSGHHRGEQATGGGAQ